MVRCARTLTIRVVTPHAHNCSVCRFKQSKAERDAGVHGMEAVTFTSAKFTHVLAALAADKRTEREQFALVELMLYQMFKPDSKKTKGKDKEVKLLRKQIVQDKWKKAIHSVIARESISEAVAEKKRLEEESLQVESAAAGLTQSQPSPGETSWCDNGANTSEGCWQHWQQGMGMRMGSMTNMMRPHMLQPMLGHTMQHPGAPQQESNACVHHVSSETTGKFEAPCLDRDNLLHYF